MEDEERSDAAVAGLAHIPWTILHATVDAEEDGRGGGRWSLQPSRGGGTVPRASDHAADDFKAVMASLAWGSTDPIDVFGSPTRAAAFPAAAAAAASTAPTSPAQVKAAVKALRHALRHPLTTVSDAPDDAWAGINRGHQKTTAAMRARQRPPLPFDPRESQSRSGGGAGMAHLRPAAQERLAALGLGRRGVMGGAAHEEERDEFGPGGLDGSRSPARAVDLWQRAEEEPSFDPEAGDREGSRGRLESRGHAVATRISSAIAAATAGAGAGAGARSSHTLAVEGLGSSSGRASGPSAGVRGSARTQAESRGRLAGGAMAGTRGLHDDEEEEMSLARLRALVEASERPDREATATRLHLARDVALREPVEDSAGEVGPFQARLHTPSTHRSQQPFSGRRPDSRGSLGASSSRLPSRHGLASAGQRVLHSGSSFTFDGAVGDERSAGAPLGGPASAVDAVESVLAQVEAGTRAVESDVSRALGADEVDLDTLAESVRKVVHRI